MAVFKHILATILLGVSSCALAALPAEATVWMLKDFYPNFDSADTCALARSAGTLPHDWYAVVEPSLSTCIGATSGTCWRRGANPSRAQGGPASGYGWDYQTWSSSNQFFYFGYIIYGVSVIDTLQMDNPESNVVLPESVNDAEPNPLWSTVYHNSGTHRYYDNSGNLLGTTTFGEYAHIEVNKIDDPVSGAPSNALRIEAWSGPTVRVHGPSWRASSCDRPWRTATGSTVTARPTLPMACTGGASGAPSCSRATAAGSTARKQA